MVRRVRHLRLRASNRDCAARAEAERVIRARHRDRGLGFQPGCYQGHGDAMPILEKAKRVCVLTVTKEKAIDTRRSRAELAKHLARHGADVVLDEVDAKGRSIGDVFEAHVTYRNAD